jgi:hypothetical protein
MTAWRAASSLDRFAFCLALLCLGAVLVMVATAVMS